MHFKKGNTLYNSGYVWSSSPGPIMWELSEIWFTSAINLLKSNFILLSKQVDRWIQKVSACIRVPALFSCCAHEVADVTSSLCHSSNHILVCLTLVNWHAVDGHDRVILGVQDECWHFDIFHFLKTARIIVVLGGTRPLWVYFPCEFFIEVAPCFDFR